MLRMQNFLLIQLDFELYFLKLMCTQLHISVHSGARLLFDCAPQHLEAFAFAVSLGPFRIMCWPQKTSR